MAECEEMGGKSSKETKTFEKAELLKKVFEAIECGFAEQVGCSNSVLTCPECKLHLRLKNVRLRFDYWAHMLLPWV